MPSPGDLPNPGIEPKSPVSPALTPSSGVGNTGPSSISTKGTEGKTKCRGPADVGNLVSGSSAFSKTSLNNWKFTVHVLLKPGFENFEHKAPRTDSAWDLQPLCLERMGGARAGVGWTSSNLSRYSPDLGGEKVFPTLETKISSLFFLIFQEEKGFSLNFLFVD